VSKGVLTNKETIMPDGRPLYAWENEIAMLRANEAKVEAQRKQLDNMMRLCQVKEIIDEGIGFQSKELTIRIKAI